jgi:hypothetical protein
MVVYSEVGNKRVPISSTANQVQKNVVPLNQGKTDTLTIVTVNPKTGKETITRRGSTRRSTGLPSIAPPSQAETAKFYAEQKPDLTQGTKVNERILAKELAKPGSTQTVSQGFMQSGMVQGANVPLAQSGLAKPVGQRTKEEQVAIIQAAQGSEAYQASVQKEAIRQQELKQRLVQTQPVKTPLSILAETKYTPKEPVYDTKKMGNYVAPTGAAAESIRSIHSQIVSGAKETLIDVPFEFGKSIGAEARLGTSKGLLGSAEAIIKVPKITGEKIGAGLISAGTLIVTKPFDVAGATIESFLKKPFKFATSTLLTSAAIGGVGTIASPITSTVSKQLIGREILKKAELVGSTKTRSINVGGETKSLVNVKGVLKFNVKQVGVGYFNKGKIYDSFVLKEPIKIKSLVGVENVSVAKLKQRIVDSGVKFAEANLGKVKASGAYQLEKLEDLLSKDIATSSSKIVLGYPQTSRLYGESRVSKELVKQYVEPKSGKVVGVETKVDLLKVNLAKVIGKSKGVTDVSKSLTRSKFYEKFSKEGNLISTAGKTTVEEIGLVGGSPISVKLRGGFYSGAVKPKVPKVEVGKEVVKPKVPMSKAAVDYFKNDEYAKSVGIKPTALIVSEPVVSVPVNIGGGKKALMLQKQVVSVVDKVVTAEKSAVELTKATSVTAKTATKTVEGLLKRESVFDYLKKKQKNLIAEEALIPSIEYDYNPNLKVGEIPKLDSSVSLKSESLVKPTVVLKPDLVNRSKINVKTDTVVRVDTSLKENVVLKSDTILRNQTNVRDMTNVAQRQLIKTLTKITPKVKIASTIIPKFSIIQPPVKIPIVPLNSNFFRKSKKSVSNLVGAFEVISRVKGKKVKLASGLPRNLALAVGKSFTGKTTARSFTIKQIGLTSKRDIGGVDLLQYRTPKVSGRVSREGFTFVEKARFAINTPGEVRGLKVGKVKAKLFK